MRTEANDMHVHLYCTVLYYAGEWKIIESKTKSTYSTVHSHSKLKSKDFYNAIKIT